MPDPLHLRSITPADRVGGPMAGQWAVNAFHDDQPMQSAHAIRWPKASFPLLVWLDHTYAPCEDAFIWESLALWEKIAERPLFQRAAHAEHAAITVSWQRQPLSARPNSCGLAQCNASPAGELYHANVTIVVDAAIDAHLSPQLKRLRWQATIAHEMGHALGLRHVIEPMAIMHHDQGWKQHTPTAADRGQWHRLYGNV